MFDQYIFERRVQDHSVLAARWALKSCRAVPFTFMARWKRLTPSGKSCGWVPFSSRVHDLARAARIKAGRVLVKLLSIAATVIVLSQLSRPRPIMTQPPPSVLITIELLRSAHLQGVQPVRAALTTRIILPLTSQQLARARSTNRHSSGHQQPEPRSNRAQRSRNHRKSKQPPQSTGTGTKLSRASESGGSSACDALHAWTEENSFVSPRDLNRHTAENCNSHSTTHPTQAQHSNPGIGEGEAHEMH